MYTSIPRKCIDTISTKFVSPECYLTIYDIFTFFNLFLIYITHTFYFMYEHLTSQTAEEEKRSKKGT